MNNANQITQGQPKGYIVTKDLVVADFYDTSRVAHHILHMLDTLDYSSYTNTQTFKVTVIVEPAS